MKLPASTSNAVQGITTTTIKVQVSAGDTPFKGSASGKVIIIEFSDYQCPFCQSAEATISQILSNYPNDVKIYYRNFPLVQLHPNAINASMAAECSNEQGKFWEMHDKLFANQKNLDVPSLKEYAKDLGLDSAKFNNCLDSNKYKDQIVKDYNDGIAAGVQGTPDFFINGVLIEGAQPYSVFDQAIKSVLGG